MSRTLTKKQKGFVEDYLVTGIGVQAALGNYGKENKPISYDTAKSIATENLTKPYIQKEIAERLPDDLLAERHLELLNKKEVLIRNNVTSGEIEVIPTGEIDVNAVAKGLDMAYKIKSTYAAEKSINVNVNVEELRDEIKQNLADFRANKHRENILPQSTEVI